MIEKLVYLDFIEMSYSKKIKRLIDDNNLENIDEDLASEYCQTLKRKCEYITLMCKDYPDSLKLLPNPPLVIYYIGNIKLISEKQIAIIGSRYNTEYGKKYVEYITRQIKGYVITSGYAYGIDQFAHMYAMKNGLSTVAVLGGGFDYVYPNNDEKLIEDIKKANLLISEYPPEVKPKPWHFLMRNRIIAGLSDKILVIEAEPKSGSLKTVEVGIEQNKEIYALPGQVFSKTSTGTNLLIEEGANVLTKETRFEIN